MKKVSIIYPIVLFILMLVFVVYAQIKANEAAKSYQVAIAAQQEAERQAEEAMRQQDLANEAAARAVVCQSTAEELMAELNDCKNK